MTQLSIRQMEAIVAGDGGWQDFADGFCAVWGVANLASGFSLSANPVGGTLTGGCAVYGAWRTFS